MTRNPLFPLLDTELMLWEPLGISDSEGKAWIKTLSKDDSTDARTALIKFDPGFKQCKSTSTWPIEMFVLEGEMQSSHRSFYKNTFHYRPAGAEYGPIYSASGITRLVFTADSRTDASPDEVYIQDIEVMPFEKSYSDPNDPRSGQKVLHEDPIAGYTLLFGAVFFDGQQGEDNSDNASIKAVSESGIYVAQGTTPGKRVLQGFLHTHPHTEEAFVLEGEFDDYTAGIEGHVIQKAGFYLCRAPYSNPHGDATLRTFPIKQIIRRGWVGDWTKYHDTYDSISVPQIDFRE